MQTGKGTHINAHVTGRIYQLTLSMSLTNKTTAGCSTDDAGSICGHGCVQIGEYRLGVLQLAEST